jgi:anti-sigma regulatory factor (Ser/Thr protein kinase)
VLPLRSGSDSRAGEDVAVAVTEASQVGEARRAAAALVGQLGFDATEAGKVALVVTEAANNLAKHATGGELLLGAVEREGVTGIQVLALDRGPGMADLGRCLRDGFSTAGTPGTGLGAITRLSSLFDIHSAAHVGTAVLARLWSGPLPAGPAAPGLEVGAVSLPRPGERVCGDAWAVEQGPGRSLFLVTDGLGHGPLAAEAAREAVRVFRECAHLDPAAILDLIHGALRSTRGAAVAVVEVNRANEQVRCAGVGNISGTILAAGASRCLVSHNGTVGHALHKVQEFTYPFPAGALLVLHSDGLATSWRLDRYPGLAARHPSLVAGVLYRDFKRGRDDVTVVVAHDETRDGV